MKSTSLGRACQTLTTGKICLGTWSRSFLKQFVWVTMHYLFVTEELVCGNWFILGWCLCVILVWTFCWLERKLGACRCMHMESFTLAPLSLLSWEFTMWVFSLCYFRFLLSPPHNFCNFCVWCSVSKNWNWHILMGNLVLLFFPLDCMAAIGKNIKSFFNPTPVMLLSVNKAFCKQHLTVFVNIYLQKSLVCHLINFNVVHYVNKYQLSGQKIRHFKLLFVF